MAGPTIQPALQPADQRMVADLQRRVRELELERERHSRRRWTHALLKGAALSLLVHLIILTLLAFIHRAGSGGGGPTGVSIEFAILSSEELSTDPAGASLDDLTADMAAVTEAIDASVVESFTPSIDSASTDRVALGGPSSDGGGLGGGAGSGSGGGLGGGGGGTSFFGISTKGTRFAYVLDMSGSMNQEGRFETACRELARSLEELPDHAYAYIVLFSTGFQEPPSQKGWMRTRRSAVRNVLRWLDTVDPTGGTYPKEAFIQVFSLDVRPDVVYFLTDGMIEGLTPQELADMNSRGRHVVINTIAFGELQGQSVLRQIALDSGGVFRYVPTGAP